MTGQRDSGLVFTEAGHSYAVAGVRVPSVTQILGHFFGGFEHVRADALRYASERGKAVHFACELIDRGTLDEASIDPGIAGYINAYNKFRRECDFEPGLIEQPLYSAGLRVAGTPDRVGRVNRRQAVVDLKSGGRMPWHGLQVAGYALLVPAPTEARYTLHLREDGSYRLEPHRDMGDFEDFKTLVRTYHLLSKHGAIKA